MLAPASPVPGGVHPIAPAAAAAPTPRDAAVAGALEQLSRVRRTAGLGAFAWSPQLARAAQAHADYLAQRFPEPLQPTEIPAHTEEPDTPGFTGKTPAERALAAGYPHRKVDENVSLGRRAPEAAIDGLMTAIYHRLSLLDGTTDEIGIGHAGAVYVLLEGRSDYRDLCGGKIPEARYEPPALCLGRRVAARYVEALCKPLPETAHYQPPYRYGCPHGVRLDRRYMEQLCASPPADALLEGSGSYTEPCGAGTRIAADWWRRFCDDLPGPARYRGSPHYYSLCDDNRKLDGQWLHDYCAGLPASADYAYNGSYVEVCKDPELRIHAQWLGRLDKLRRTAQPRQLVWPPDGAVDVPPAFYEESPDPLPDLETAGDPLSIQFNPDRVATVQIQDYHLWRVEARTPRREIPLRSLNARSDPHHKLGALDYGFFPLEHLGWGRRYQAQVHALVDGKPLSLKWGFSTRDPGVPVLSPGGAQHRLEIPADHRFLLFLPPTTEAPRPLAAYSYRAPAAARVEVEPLDYNSAVFRVSGAGCQTVVLELAGGHCIELQARGCARPAPGTPGDTVPQASRSGQTSGNRPSRPEAG